MLTEMKSRFQLVITIVLFLPVLLDALGKTSGVTDLVLGKTTLQYSVVMAIVLLIYVFIEIIDKKIWQWLLKTINILSLVEIGFFAVIFIFMSTSTSPTADSLPSLLLSVFELILKGVLFLPICILILLIFNMITALFVVNHKS